MVDPESRAAIVLDLQDFRYGWLDHYYAAKRAGFTNVELNNAESEAWEGIDDLLDALSALAIDNSN